MGQLGLVCPPIEESVDDQISERPTLKCHRDSAPIWKTVMDDPFCDDL
jgi:hypothetical protein